MIKHIEIVEGDKRQEYIRRFQSQARRYKYMGFMVVGIIAVITALLVTSYATGTSTAMTLGMSMALLAVFSIPFMMMHFNKSWQLGADTETDRVQVLTGRISKIKKETKGKKTFLVITMDRVDYKINEEHCSGVDVDRKVAIVTGISSKVPVEVTAVEE